MMQIKANKKLYSELIQNINSAKSNDIKFFLGEKILLTLLRNKIHTIFQNLFYNIKILSNKLFSILKLPVLCRKFFSFILPNKGILNFTISIKFI